MVHQNSRRDHRKDSSSMGIDPADEFPIRCYGSKSTEDRYRSRANAWSQPKQIGIEVATEAEYCNYRQGELGDIRKRLFEYGAFYCIFQKKEYREQRYK